MTQMHGERDRCTDTSVLKPHITHNAKACPYTINTPTYAPVHGIMHTHTHTWMDEWANRQKGEWFLTTQTHNYYRGREMDWHTMITEAGKWIESSFLTKPSSKTKTQRWTLDTQTHRCTLPTRLPKAQQKDTYQFSINRLDEMAELAILAKLAQEISQVAAQFCQHLLFLLVQQITFQLGQGGRLLHLGLGQLLQAFGVWRRSFVQQGNLLISNFIHSQKHTLTKKKHKEEKNKQHHVYVPIRGKTVPQSFKGRVPSKGSFLIKHSMVIISQTQRHIRRHWLNITMHLKYTFQHCKSLSLNYVSHDLWSSSIWSELSNQLLKVCHFLEINKYFWNNTCL